MLKFLQAAFLGLLMSLFVTACGDNSNSPEHVAVAYMTHMTSGNVDEAFKLLDIPEQAKGREAQIKGKLGALTPAIKEAIAQRNGIKTIKADKATKNEQGIYNVIVKVSYGDGSEESESIKVQDVSGTYLIKL